MTNPATFLITGANGFIGAHLATLAIHQSHTVHTLTRGDWSHQPAVPVVSRFFGRFPNQIPPTALRNVQIVVHCAAVTGADERASQAVNVTGTLRLAEMAKAAGARTFIFLSSQSAKPDAVSVYGRTKYAAEQALKQLAGLDVIILRPGLVCGAGSRGLFQRMCGMVASLPILPLLGGDRALVQPIHVDDLCAAIFTCAGNSGKFAGSILQLGDPEGLTLADFLQHIAHARLGKRKMAVTIPLWPVEAAVATAEALGVALPINSNNLKGMKVVERMDTGPDLARLGLQLRSIKAAVADSLRKTEPHPTPDLDHRAVRLLLVGGGRIGMVHALTLSRLHGIDFAGVVDSKPAALNLLKGMGLKTHTHTALDSALHASHADAAVIATPAASHLALARTCLSKGLGVMVEKPLAVHPEELAKFQQLADEFPRRAFGVGYVMVRNPQVSTLIERLRAGEFGQVKRFLGLTLHAYILQPDPKRWEVNKKISGGGVLINSGGHVLSMIHAAFGSPAEVTVESRKIHSGEVEDSLVTRFRYPAFEGEHCASWSIPGYQRQENRLVIWADQAVLILTGSVGLVLRHDGQTEVVHQLDFDVGFNLAPDYAGAGFSTELADLAAAVRTHRAPPMSVREAIQVEQLLFQVYARAREVQHFTAPLAAPAIECRDAKVTGQSSAAAAPKRILDLRELAAPTVAQYLRNPSAWDEYLITTAHLTPAAAIPGDRMRLTVPDFLQQSRLLMAGRYADVLKQLGAGGVVAAGLAALPAAVKARGVSFWAAALGLLAGDLQRVPAGFTGTLLLHGYLVDLALTLGKVDLLDQMLRRCRKARPTARLGLHTNLAAELEHALPLLETKLDEVSVLAAPGARDLDAMFASFRQTLGPSVRLTAEVGPAPALVHQLAARDPRPWTHGAEAVLLGPAADAALAGVLRAEKSAAWQGAFPGLEIPDCAL